MPGSLYATFIASSLVLFVIGVPMGLGKVKQNHWYGVRLPITYKSIAAWDSANIQYGWWLVVAGAVSLLVLMLGWAIGAPAGGLITVYVIVILIPLIGGVVPSVMAAYKAQAREDELEAKDAEESPDKKDKTKEPPADESHDELPSQFR